MKLKNPTIHPSVYVADGAKIIGDVTIAQDSSIWYNSVLRADIAAIKIGCRTNIQDGTVIHVDVDQPCLIGNDVTVGHGCVLHACTLEDACFIGMGAVVLSGAVIKTGAVVGAGAVVKENAVVEANTLVVGVPAEFRKQLPASQKEHHLENAKNYHILARNMMDT